MAGSGAASRSACGPTRGAASGATSSPSSASCIIIVFIIVGMVAGDRQPRRPTAAARRRTTPTQVELRRSRPKGCGSPPSLVAPVRHRLPRPRRLLAHARRDAHLAARRRHRRRHRPDHRPRRSGRSRATTGAASTRVIMRTRRRLLRLPLHPLRAAHHDRAGPGLRQRVHRHRHPRLGDATRASTAARC